MNYSRVNSPNSGCLVDIGNGPQSGPALFSKAKGREAAHQFIMGPKAASGPSVSNAAEGRKVAHHCVGWPESGIL